jgi:hypothetical protein
LKTFKITEELREQARKLGLELVEEIKKRKGQSMFPHPEGQLVANWQGALAEIIIQQNYPQLNLFHPSVAYSEDCKEADFYYGNMKYELKCNRWGDKLFDTFHVNVDRFLRSPDYKILICSTINGHPADATELSVRGWIERCYINTYPKISARYSLVYDVPVSILADIETLFPVPLNETSLHSFL